MYVIGLDRPTYRWMVKQTPEVQRVLGHIIATRWNYWETPSLNRADIQAVFHDLTGGWDLVLGCKAMDEIFHYDHINYKEV